MSERRPSPFGDDTRGKVLRGTARAVLEHGVRNCTVQHILDAAPVSRRTFYKQFKSLEHALEALFDTSVGLLERTVLEAARHPADPNERLLAALDAYLALQEMGGSLIVTLQSEAVRIDSPLAPHRTRLLDTMTALFAAEGKALTGRDLDPMVFRALLLGVEGLINDVQQRGPFTAEARAHVRGVIVPLFMRVLELPDAPPLPDARPQ